MLTIISCKRSRVGEYTIKNAEEESVRRSVAKQAELESGLSSDFIIIMDGMGSISLGFTLLRYITEVDTPRRLAILGADGDIARLLDAWEKARLDELQQLGRLVVLPGSTDLDIIEIADAWSLMAQ